MAKLLGDKFDNTLAVILDNFIRNVITLLNNYTPIDTGRLLSSIYINADEVDKVRIGFDLNTAPYAVFVHEIPKFHQFGRHKFLEDAIIDAKKITPGSEVLNVVVNIQQSNKGGLLEAVINGTEDDFGPYTTTVSSNEDLNVLVNKNVSKSGDTPIKPEELENNEMELWSVTRLLINNMSNDVRTKLLSGEATQQDLRTALNEQVENLDIELPKVLRLNRRRL